MRRFGKYLLFKKISSGGMADVFAAKATGFRGFTKTVAIKRIYPHLLDRDRFLRMFTDEAKIASRLVHPNIVQIYDLGQEDGVPYIAMELVPGRDLHMLLYRLSQEGGALPIHLVCYIISEVCEGLHFAHEFRDLDGEPQSIVHRDISPRNILISFDGQVKLTDFGIARARDREEHTEHGLIKGKVRYISPEAARGREVDRRSDIFSLGVVLAESLTLEPFFDGANQIEILLAIRDGTIDRQRLLKVPVELRGVVERALSPEPEGRYATAAEMALDIRQAIDGLRPAQGELAAFMGDLFASIIAKEREEQRKVEQVLAQHPSLLETRDTVLDAELADLLASMPMPVDTLVEEAPDEGPVLLPLDDLEQLDPSPVAKAQPSSLELDLKPVIEGDLARESLTHLLHRLARSRLIGRLDVRRDPVLKSVFLVDGEPVFAVSNVEAELFGEYLTSRGLLTPEQHAQAVGRAEKHTLRLIDVLLELELIQPHELFQHLADQVRERILDLFGWPSGKFAFYKDQQPPEAGVPLRLRTLALVHEGVLGRVPFPVIRQRLEPVRQTAFRLAGPLPSELTLSGREQRIVRAIEAIGTLTLTELVRQERSEEQVLRLIYLLTEIEALTWALPASSR